MGLKLSIITITRNSERYLRETIDSVISQDYPDFEYIVVDGGSTDGTLDIIRDYAAREPRIRWISEPDEGISDAMNKGIRLATGDVVAHIHSDDYYAGSDVFSRVAAAFMENPGGIWLTGGEYIVDDRGVRLREIRVRRYGYRKLVRCNFILHPATFVRMEGFRAAGVFDTRWKYAMDYDLWLRLGSQGAPVRIDRPLACFRLHGGSVSSLESRKAFDEALAIRRELLKGEPLRFFFHYLYYLLKRGRNNRSTRHLRSGVRQDG
jgi:glycosyltransferase involved in cell wall biosynthesis